VKNTLSKEVLGNIPTAMVLGGPDDGKVFPLKQDQIRIGRIDPEKRTGITYDDDIVLSEGYTAVTRISKPHGRFILEHDNWYIEDCGSTGGTRINHHRVEKNTKIVVHDGDLIELAKGISGVKILMIIPQR
jgi:pSer/pThr/pTyr-binding forkhead associated (FHA) protein